VDDLERLVNTHEQTIDRIRSERNEDRSAADRYSRERDHWKQKAEATVAELRRIRETVVDSRQVDELRGQLSYAKKQVEALTKEKAVLQQTLDVARKKLDAQSQQKLTAHEQNVRNRTRNQRRKERKTRAKREGRSTSPSSEESDGEYSPGYHGPMQVDVPSPRVSSPPPRRYTPPAERDVTIDQATSPSKPSTHSTSASLLSRITDPTHREMFNHRPITDVWPNGLDQFNSWFESSKSRRENRMGILNSFLFHRDLTQYYGSIYSWWTVEHNQMEDNNRPSWVNGLLRPIDESANDSPEMPTPFASPSLWLNWIMANSSNREKYQVANIGYELSDGRLNLRTHRTWGVFTLTLPSLDNRFKTQSHVIKWWASLFIRIFGCPHYYTILLEDHKYSINSTLHIHRVELANGVMFESVTPLHIACELADMGITTAMADDMFEWCRMALRRLLLDRASSDLEKYKIDWKSLETTVTIDGVDDPPSLPNAPSYYPSSMSTAPSSTLTPVPDTHHEGASLTNDGQEKANTAGGVKRKRERKPEPKPRRKANAKKAKLDNELDDIARQATRSRPTTRSSTSKDPVPVMSPDSSTHVHSENSAGE
jgi:hypothetical protein